MDPISSAVILSITAGIMKVGEQVPLDLYNYLKELFKKKFGEQSKVVEAIAELEANPSSSARKEVVKEEIAAVKADKDQELLKTAKALLDAIQVEKYEGQKIRQSVVGDKNIALVGNGNTVRTD